MKGRVEDTRGPWRAGILLLVGVALLGGCAGPLRTGATLPNGYSLSREQLVIHSDFPLAPQHRLLEELTARRFDLARWLALPLRDEPIHVYLFEDAQRFHALMRLRHPEFAERRAFFAETDTRLSVYAHWGDRVAEDLRHEVTHGYLHSVVPNLPLWLDEGLAEYFEVPRGQHGLNRPHLERILDQMRQGRFRPDVRRLEQFDSSFSMGQDDYAESWAWVHFLLRSRLQYRELLQGYLAELRREGSTAPLSVRLESRAVRPEEPLLEHIRHLGAALGR